LVKVSIEGNEFKQKENEISLNLVTKETRVLIKTKTENGETKEYTLDIYRSKDSLLKPNLSMLLVNGVLIEPEFRKSICIKQRNKNRSKQDRQAKLYSKNTIKLK